MGGLRISKPRITVNVSRDNDGKPARCVVRIYNIAQESERQIRERGNTLTVRAGYGGSLAQVFVGPVTRVTRSRDKGATARVVVIEAGDETINPDSPGGGAFTFGYTEARPARAIVRDVAAEMGLNVGSLNAIPGDLSFVWYWAGSGSEALADLKRKIGNGVTYSIQDGTLNWNAARVANTDVSRVRLSPETGLIGVPDVSDEGIAVESFLNTTIAMGSIVDLVSETVTGVYKVVALVLDLDNWNGPFVSRLQLGELES